jgi:asparaginyl-tRNA synthetase
LKGWIRNIRVFGNFGFIDLNDGSFFKGIQIVFENSLENFEEISKARIGSVEAI